MHCFVCVFFCVRRLTHFYDDSCEVFSNLCRILREKREARVSREEEEEDDDERDRDTKK